MRDENAMTRRAYGYLDWGKEAVLLPNPPKRVRTTGTDAGQTDLLAPVVPAARMTDPATSNDAIGDVLPRAGSQQHKLLLAYGSRPMGLIAEEAAEIAGLNRVGCSYWKRIGELLHAGLIEDTYQERTASTGSSQRVCAITSTGKRAIR